MATEQTSTDAVVLRQAHTAVRDLLRPRMGIYWADFVCSYGLAAGLFVAAAVAGMDNPWSWPLIVLSGLALYRAAVFIHEIVHFVGRVAFAHFRLVWNAVLGIPWLIPMFMYECHAEHHNWRHYGTTRDAEYVPLARLPRWRIVGVVAAIPLLPLYGLYRFGVLTPAAWVIPALRDRVWRRSSALKLDIEYEGAPPSTPQQARSWKLQEAAAAMVIAVMTLLGVTGALPWQIFVQLYLTYTVVACVNTFRLLGAHRYLGDEDTMSVMQQVADTVNYPHSLLGELWAPVGLRLHALHHMLPGLPYHSYPEAHRRLLAALPSGSVYHEASAPGLLYSLRRLWRTSGRYRELRGLDAADALAAADLVNPANRVRQTAG